MTDPSASILVTGAAGFIASHVCQALLARGQRVVGLDSFDPFYDPARKRRTIAELAQAARPGAFSLVEGDILDAPALAALCARERFSGIIHLAARAGVRPSLEQPAAYARTNLEGTINILEAARALGGVRVVAASSSSVYGNNPKVPFAEDDDVSAPISPYAASKRACEMIAHTYHHLYGLPIAMLRFFTVYGPRQRPDLAIAQFIDRVASGRPITLFGDGSSSRDYTFISDIVAGVLAAYDRIPAAGLRVWNLGGAHPVTLGELVAGVERAVGKRAVIQHGPARPGDVERTFADLSRSRLELGYQPRVALEQGLAIQAAWQLDAARSPA